MTATVITETNTYPATVSAPVPGDAADADTLTTVALQPIVNRTNYLKTRQDLLGLYVPASGTLIASQTIGYSTAGALTALLDTSSDPVTTGIWTGVTAGDIITGTVFFKVVLVESSSVDLYAGVKYDFADAKLNHIGLSPLDLSGSITVGNQIIPVALPIYYPVVNSGNFSLDVWVTVAGSPLITNLYEDNDDWCYLQLLRPAT